jgi:3-deoxy-manno-octulosonate cytidylyltransferase (CMP-KDO synthetase)
MTDFHVIIPARMNSSRLPGKVLREIGDKPMLAHVCERAKESGAASILIATDDERVMALAADLKLPACMTEPSHPTGTDRIAEAIRLNDYADDAIIVGLQADEPFMPVQLIQQLARALDEQTQAPVATLCAPLQTVEQVFDPHIVKVVRDANQHALYFSRAPIAWQRETFALTPKQLNAAEPHYGHIGLYAYRASFVKRFVGWKPAPIEVAEQLEQLRILYHGENIYVATADVVPPPGVNTLEEFEAICEHHAC